jgi:competence protein ComEC
VLSVAHGLATVVDLPSGQTLLYDAGQMAAPRAATRTIAECLWSRGLMHLDAVILSHADVDHYNALPRMFSICRFLNPRQWGLRPLTFSPQGLD